MTDIADIGSAKRDAATNTILVQAKTAPIGDSADDAPGFDGVPFFGQLGVFAMPWPADDRGSAEALVDENVPGNSGVITSIRDLRAAKVIEEMGPGETAIASTGPGFDTRVFLKKQLLSLMVGDDCTFTIDRENKKVMLAAFGLVFEMSEKNGITLTTGGATMQLKDELAYIGGSSTVLGGRTPLFPLASLAIPQALGTAPGTPIVGIAQTPGVFIGV